MKTNTVNLRSLFNQCVLCHSVSNETDIQLLGCCDGCFNDLPWITDKCQLCALPLETQHDQGLRCGQCISKPPRYDKIEALFHYDFPFDRLISEIKYNRQRQYLGALSELLHHSLPSLDGIDVILPVPLHQTNLHQRGFNQAEILARFLSKKRNIPIDCRSLQKTRLTNQQMSLARADRIQNLKGAFSCKPLTYQHVAIVDDVMTTGTTMNQISDVVKKAGAKKVTGLVLCRTDK